MRAKAARESAWKWPKRPGAAAGNLCLYDNLRLRIGVVICRAEQEAVLGAPTGLFAPVQSITPVTKYAL
jgi:hypothetical protein